MTGITVSLALALFVAALYFPLLFTNRVLASGDILHYFYPYRDYAAAALRAGRIPFWNPYIFSGAPFLANPQAAVLYPLHWPLSWLTVTQQIYWSAAIHTWILGMGGYVLMRRWQASAWASLLSAFVLAGSGFYGGLLGHINQMNGAAWLPWAVLTLEMATGNYDRRIGAANTAVQWTRRAAWIVRSEALRYVVLFGLLTALMLLAGHIQTAFINLFGLGLWTIWPRLPWRRWRDLSGVATEVWPRLAVYAVGVALGVLLSAAQLLPTLELSGLGLRSGGLNYWDATSFSLRPLKLAWTLLPSYGLVDLSVVFDTLGYTEFVAYVGLLGLALGLFGAWRGRGVTRAFGILFIVAGLFLAFGRWNPFYFLLYKLAPGFDLFRAPARWMMLYVMGMSVLAGLGLDALASHIARAGPAGRTRLVNLGVVVLVAIELVVAARALPHAHPTAPQAVYDMRTAPAFLRTDPQRTAVDPAAAGRFLSLSTTTFDPGDMDDWQRILLESDPAQLDPRAFEQMIIALKGQEILAPNLSMLWRVPAVDGFDGGVLPLRRYIDLSTLLISPDQLVPDGRLREQIVDVPSTDLLNLFDVQYVITDKVRDLWFEGVYYDRQIGARLTTAHPILELEIPLPFEATHIDVVGTIAADVQKLKMIQDANQAVAVVSIHDAAGTVDELSIDAGGEPGAHFADGELGSSMATSSGATIAFRDVEGGREEYRARLALPAPTVPTAMTIARLDDEIDVIVQAVTLFDARTGMFAALLPSDRGRFQIVHSGDVKVYENLDVRARAYLAHEVRGVESSSAALDVLRGGDLDLTSAAVVEGVDSFQRRVHAEDSVEVISYGAEEIVLNAATVEPAFLILSDAHYPGWRATVDGEETPIHAANVLFRGLRLPAGQHLVRFQFQPDQWRPGLWLSLLGVAICLAVLVRRVASRRQERPGEV